MKRVLSAIIGAVMCVTCLVLPANAELVESTGKVAYVKNNSSYVYTVDDNCTPMTFVLSGKESGTAYCQLTGKGDGSLKHTICAGEYIDEAVYTVEELSIDYKKTYNELLAKYDTTGEIKKYMPTYKEFLAKDPYSLSEEAYYAYYTIWYELPPSVQNTFYTLTAGTATRITLKGTNPGDSFTLKFTSDKELVQTNSLKATMPYVTLKKGTTLNIYQEGAKYSTSNKNVASVSSKGIITAKKAGSCYVTMTLNGKKSIYPVKVYTGKYTPSKIYNNVFLMNESPDKYSRLTCDTPVTLTNSELKTNKFYKFTLLRPTTIKLTVSVDGSRNAGYTTEDYWGVLRCATFDTLRLTDGKTVLYEEKGDTEAFSEFQKNVFSSTETFTYIYEYPLSAGTYYIDTSATSLKLGDNAITMRLSAEKDYFVCNGQKPTINLKKGETMQLSGDGAMFSVKYSSTKNKIATVTSSGKVTAKSKGTCVVSVYIDGTRYMYTINVV